MTALTIGLEGGLERGAIEGAIDGDLGAGMELVAGVLRKFEEEPAFCRVVDRAEEGGLEGDHKMSLSNRRSEIPPTLLERGGKGN